MRILGFELRKILNWKLILALALFTALFISSHCSFYLNEYTINPTTGIHVINTYTALLERYGTTVSEDDLDDFENTYIAGLKAELNAKIAGLKDFQDAGITTVDELDDITAVLDSDEWRYASKEDRMKFANILYAQKDPLVKELDGIEDSNSHIPEVIYAGPYYYYSTVVKETDLLRKEIADQSTTSSSPEEATVLPYCINFRQLAYFLSELLLIAAAVLFGPYLVREKRSGVQVLAFTTKCGRRLTGLQLAAAAFAAVPAALVPYAMFAGAYLNSPHRYDLLFLDCRMSNAANSITFRQLVLWDSLTAIVLALGFALCVYAVSRYLRNYVTLLAVEIPMLFLAVQLSRWVLTVPCDPVRTLICAACFLVPAVFCVFQTRHIGKAEVR